MIWAKVGKLQGTYERYVSEPLWSLHVSEGVQAVANWFKNHKNSRESGADVAPAGKENPLLKRFRARQPAASRLWASSNLATVKGHAGSSQIGATSHSTAVLFRGQPLEVQKRWRDKAKQEGEGGVQQCFE